MRRTFFLNTVLFIFAGSLCTSSFIVNVQAAGWSKVPSPTTAWLRSTHMLNSTEGWIVGADGTIYHWQEEAPDFPIEALIILNAVIIAAVIVWIFLRKRNTSKSG
jgi:hypothetical protein